MAITLEDVIREAWVPAARNALNAQSDAFYHAPTNTVCTSYSVRKLTVPIFIRRIDHLKQLEPGL